MMVEDEIKIKQIFVAKLFEGRRAKNSIEEGGACEACEMRVKRGNVWMRNAGRNQSMRRVSTVYVQDNQSQSGASDLTDDYSLGDA